MRERKKEPWKWKRGLKGRVYKQSAKDTHEMRNLENNFCMELLQVSSKG